MNSRGKRYAQYCAGISQELALLAQILTEQRYWSHTSVPGQVTIHEVNSVTDCRSQLRPVQNNYIRPAQNRGICCPFPIQIRSLHATQHGRWDLRDSRVLGSERNSGVGKFSLVTTHNSRYHCSFGSSFCSSVRKANLRDGTCTAATASELDNYAGH